MTVERAAVNRREKRMEFCKSYWSMETVADGTLSVGDPTTLFFLNSRVDNLYPI